MGPYVEPTLALQLMFFDTKKAAIKQTKKYKVIA
jgi:hypothetical protein